MNQRIKVGIFLGGRSREREISFAGGRTVYDNLDKGLFEPIPIFVDSFHHLIHLHWRYLYQGSIRDFYPPNGSIPASRFQLYADSLGDLPPNQLQAHIQQIGQRITIDQLKEVMDFAFLALHGPYGEDGSIQGLLEWMQLPYSGSGILGAAIGIDKIVQKRLMQAAGYVVAPYQVIDRATWQNTLDKSMIFEELIASLGLPLVVKSPRQGSSIGVSIIHQRDLEAFIKAIDSSFFEEQVTAPYWRQLTAQEKDKWLIRLIDFRSGIGLPVRVQGQVIYYPDELLDYLNAYFTTHEDTVSLASLQGEAAVLVESFINGREFSCIVLQEAGNEPIALPPTEMLKGDLHFDYRAKYLPGLVRKETPMQLSMEQLQSLQATCVSLFKDLNFQVYARIDGILSTDGPIYLNDPNTTAGMNPSSFLFHQAAEIGLNPSQLLTFLIRNSLARHVYTYQADPRVAELLQVVDTYIAHQVGKS